MTDDIPVIGAAELRDEPMRWAVRESDVEYDTGRVTSMRRDVVLSPGREDDPDAGFVRDVVQHPGAVAVVALDDEQRVLLVRQYRHPVGHRLLEVPAGLLDVDGEDYAVAAARELLEETGMQAAEWRVLVDIFTSPGMTDESVRVFLARGLSTAATDFVRTDEEAEMDTVAAPLADLVAAVLDGRIHNPPTVSGSLAAWTSLHADGFDALRPADAPWPAREASLRTRPRTT